MGIILLAIVNDEVIFRSKVKGQGHWERKCKHRFAHVFVKLDRFTLNQHQTDRRPILNNTLASNNIFLVGMHIFDICLFLKIDICKYSSKRNATWRFGLVVARWFRST